MRRSQRRLLTSAISLAVAAAVAAATWSLRSAPRPTEVLAKTAAVDAVLAERRARAAAGELRLEPIDEATARTLFPMGSASFRYDRTTHYAYVPGLEESWEWEEHPEGGWTRRTNAAGMREDDDTSLGEVDFGVLVVGDSHTEGACNNDESFANLLEARLAASRPGRSVTVLNAGVVGYSFFQYLGVLEKHLPERPDVLVVAVYGGNDFLEVLRPWHWQRGTQMPPRRQGYRRKVETARSLSTAALAQGMNQVLYFGEHPDQVDVALEGAAFATREIRRLCAENGVRLLVAWVPPAYEVPWPSLAPQVARAREALGLDERADAASRQLAERYLGLLDDLGVPYVDGRVLLVPDPEPCYWERDLHLDLRGHRRIAEALEELVEAGAGTQGDLEPSAGTPADGPWVQHDENGRVRVRGAYRAGRREGLWTTSYPGGSPRSEGAYRAGLREGPWRFFYESGLLEKEGRFVADVAEGPWTEWHPDGTLRHHGSWSAGQPSGVWLSFFPDGSLAGSGAYRNGVREGEWLSWHAGGGLDTRTRYSEGKLHGAFERWHRSGLCFQRGDYADDQRHGRWLVFGEDGSPRAQGIYLKGKRDGRWRFWNEEGEPDPGRTGLYRSDRRVGP